MSEAWSLRGVARSTLFLYADNLAAMVLGYVFWFAISALAPPGEVGEASTAVSMAALASTASALGLPAGVRRFVGKHASRGDREALSRCSAAALAMVLGASSALAGLLYALKGFIEASMGLPAGLTGVAALLVLLVGLTQTVKGVYVASLRTKVLAFVDLAAGSVRVAVGIALVALGWNAMGIVLGYLALYAVELPIFLAMAGLRLKLKLEALRAEAPELFRAGFAAWPPAVVAGLGQQLGVIAVYGLRGSAEAGLYYIAFAVATAVMTIPTSIMGIMFPVLSGLDRGRMEAARRGIRLTLALVSPITAALMAYAGVALSFIGARYAGAAPLLAAMLPSAVMAALAGGVRVLAYAEGMYNKVLGMGLSASVPRVTLYFALTPILGGLGAASAYLVGSIGSLTAALAAAKSMKFKIGLRRFSVLVALPASVGGLVYWLGLNWAVGAALILAGSLLGYAKLGLLSKRDLGDLLKALLPTELLDEAYRKYKWMVELLFRE